MSNRANWVAHIVQAVEECDEVVVPTLETVCARHRKGDTITHTSVLGVTLGGHDGRTVSIEAIKARLGYACAIKMVEAP